MLDPSNPGFTGTFWENYNPDGTIPSSNTSLAHGWSSAPTPALTSYVLGVQPVAPGYRTFSVSPHFGTLSSAEGAIPTPYGEIDVQWRKTGNHYRIMVQAPAGTIGSVVIPGGQTAAVRGGAHGHAVSIAGDVQS